MNDKNAINNRKVSSLKIGIIVTITLISLTLIIAGVVIARDKGVLFNSTKSSSSSQLAEVGEDGNKYSFLGEGDNIESVSNKLSNSVVSIVTKNQASYGRFNLSQETEGAGTGMIVSKNGYILTNKHVVRNANTVSVILNDGTTFESAKVVATDPLNDIAFLKVESDSDLTPVELGDSKTLRIGQQVIAIGNALGQYQNSVTSGIISGTNRSIVASSSSNSAIENLSDMIQTDASINLGNSGGPLVNAKGQVIGINTAVDTSAQGIGFAIPIGAVKGMLNEIIETGTAKRAYVGVNYVQITPAVAKEHNLPVNKGAYIYSQTGSSVISGGPADKAGIKNKDIITKINNIEIGEKGSISSLTAEYRSGDKITLTVLRDGREFTTSLELGQYHSS